MALVLSNNNIMPVENLKFFIVDDDLFHRNIMKQILTCNGYNDVQIYDNGLKALNEIHCSPDVVFLDHNMDLYNGYEVLRKIKRYNPNINVIIVSSQESIETAVKTLKYGAFDYLQKDAELEDNVLSCINRIMDLQQALKKQNRSVLRKIFAAF